MTVLQYAGQELDVFAHARNWKRYWASKARPFLGGDVAEVGAGIGSNTPLLRPSAARSWTCLEPDPRLANRLREALDSDPETRSCKVVVGTTASLKQEPQFDSIIYIDVLEHIADDKEELRRAAGLLRPGGTVVVLSPAHQWLYTPFDQSIGHFRRYTTKTLAACTPSECDLVKILYLDSCGLLASLGNRLLLKQQNPSLRQIQFWDRYLVPGSVMFDPVFRFAVGKSILGVWRRLPESPSPHRSSANLDTARLKSSASPGYRR